MQQAKKYDLEKRTQTFAQHVRSFVRKIPKTLAHIEDCKQLIRSSGSVAANYIEANESFSKDDFIYRIKICRKEAKESRFWLNMINISKANPMHEIQKELIQEALELTRIFGSIVYNSASNK